MRLNHSMVSISNTLFLGKGNENMRNKKIVAQLAALSLVFGMAGVGTSWADEIIIDGQVPTILDPATRNDVTDSTTWLTKNEDGSFTVSNRDVKGAWNYNNSKLIANNVNFIDGGENFAEVGPSDGSTFIMNGGSIQTTDMRFSADSGSTAIINDAKITTGAFSNNSEVTLKNCTTSGSILYAGNAYAEENEDGTIDNAPVAEGLHEGRFTIDGGTANVKNVLVQNKALFTVTNGATLDLTGDTSAWDKELVEATGITNKGNLTVRAWGPNTDLAERENNTYINHLDQASTFKVTGKSTVKADTIDLQGNTPGKDDKTGKEIINRAKFIAEGNSNVTVNNMNIGKYGYGNFNDSQLTVNGNLSVTGIGYEDNYKYPYGLEMTGGSATLNEVVMTNYGEVAFNDATVTAKNITVADSSLKITGGSFKADTLTIKEKDYDEDNDNVELSVMNGKVELNNATFEEYGHADIKDSQFTVNGTLSLVASEPIADKGVNFFGGTATLNDVKTNHRELEFTGTTTNAKTVTANDSTIRFMGGTFNADDVSLTDNTAFCAYRNANVDVKNMTADHSYVYVGRSDDIFDDEVSAADMYVQKLTLKNDSQIVLAAGTLNSDTIDLDKSTIDIEGVGTLIANKMTLNDTTLSLKGIEQGKTATLSLADIAAYDVAKNGVHVEVKDQLVMNGGTLTVNDGSTLTTNKMALTGNSKVEVTGDKSSYTINGSGDSDNVIDEGSKIHATKGGTINIAKGAAIKATADADNNVNTIIISDASSKVNFGGENKLFVKDAKTNENYNISNAVKTADGQTTGKTFDTIYGDNIFTEGTKVGDDGTVVFKKNYEEAMQTSRFANIIKAADQSTGVLKDFLNTAYGELNGGDITKGNAALDHAVTAGEMAGVTHGTYGFAEDLSGMVAAHKADGQGIWAQYLRQDKKVDGFKVGGRDAKYDVKYNGFLIGGDFATSETSRTGIAFAYADGNNTSKDGIYTKNDTKYYGGDIYHQFTAGGIQYKADIGYIKSENDLKQIQLGTTITGSTDGNTFFAGIRGEKEIALGASSLTPYAGLRFYRVHTGDFTDSLGMKHETENANIWNLPIGVIYRHEVQNGNWNVTPVAELGYNFVMGDKDTKETVRFGTAADTFAFDIGESSFIGRLGVEANNGTWTLGGGYRYQKGSDTQSNQWYLQAGFHF